MSGSKAIILSVIAAALLCWQYVPITIHATSTGIPAPCSFLVSFIEPGSRCWFICPQGGGQTLANGGNRIRIIIEDLNSNPVPGIVV